MKRSKAYVYFLKSPLCDFIKIGKSCDMKTRVNEISKYNPLGVELIGYIVADNYTHGNIELGIHKHFKEKRKHAEWFDVSMKEIINCVESSIIPNIIDDSIKYEIDTAIYYGYLDYKYSNIAQRSVKQYWGMNRKNKNGVTIFQIKIKSPAPSFDEEKEWIKKLDEKRRKERLLAANN